MSQSMRASLPWRLSGLLVLLGAVLAACRGAAATERLVSRPAATAAAIAQAAVGAEFVTNANETRHVVLDNGVALLLNRDTKAKYADKDGLIVERGEVVVDVPKRGEPFAVRTAAEAFRTTDGKFA